MEATSSRWLGLWIIGTASPYHYINSVEILCRRHREPADMGRVLVASFVSGWPSKFVCCPGGRISELIVRIPLQIPLVAFTAQCYFGRRAYILLGRPKWFLWVVIVWGSITALCGIA